MLTTHTIPLGEIAEKITVGYVGPMSHEYVADGVPFLRSLNVKRFKLNLNDIKYINERFHQKIKKSALSPGDVVVVRTGIPGASCVIPSSLKEANCSDLVVIRCGEKLNPYFVSYYINSITQSQINGKLVGAIQQHFNIGEAKEIRFPRLDLSTQKKIAKVLSTLDAKIELNNRINAELEAMAKLIYDYWFVQFDFPMTATQAASLGRPELEGKPYKTSGGKMVFNQTLKRQIPEGWEAGTASILFQFNPTESLKEKEAMHFDMARLRTSGFMTDAPFLKRVSGGPKFRSGDVVIARITPCLENGKTGLITLLKDNEVGFGSTELIVMRGRKQTLSAFGVCFARSEYFRKFAILNMTGTSGRKRIEAPILETISMPLPNKELLTNFETTVAPMLKMMTNNEKQNQELTELRDWLLPMLMNGQVTVSE